MARIHNERYEDDWRIGPRDFSGYEGDRSEERNYGYYDPTYRWDRDDLRRVGDWGSYLRRRREWLQSHGGGQERERQDRDPRDESYWGGREGWRNPNDFGTQTPWGTHLNWTEQGSRGQGQYTGRGPKGYQRSDERIREDVNDRLTDHPDIDASDIEVRVDQGVVILSGNVDSRRTKRLAEDVTDSVRGVRDVHNQLRVTESAPAAV